VAKIIILRDRGVVQTVQLNRERTTIGRHRDNDIVLEQSTVSGEHAVIVIMRSDFFLEDLNSTNGTFVNGRRIGKYLLQNTDQIVLAKFPMQFMADDERPSGTAGGAPMTAHIQILNGANAGKQLALTKAVTTLGRPGVQVVAISRTDDAYTIVHQGGACPLVNGVAIDQGPQTLNHGDVIDLSGTKMAFSLA
jgi:pSer/pThr/pTyr-binding forkhead associated (FHA) protein